jgi:hypothetical protein
MTGTHPVLGDVEDSQADGDALGGVVALAQLGRGVLGPRDVEAHDQQVDDLLRGGEGAVGEEEGVDERRVGPVLVGEALEQLLDRGGLDRGPRAFDHGRHVDIEDQVVLAVGRVEAVARDLLELAKVLLLLLLLLDRVGHLRADHGALARVLLVLLRALHIERNLRNARMNLESAIGIP